MIKIPLSQNKVALIDDVDYPKVSVHKWFAERRNNGRIYAVTNILTPKGKRPLRMHRLIAGKNGFDVDHRDRDGLNNRRKNLRACTRSQNLMNQLKRKACLSIYKGVTFVKEKKLWRASIDINLSKKFIGYFSSEKDAALAYNAMARKLFGDYHRPNEIKETSC